MRSEGNGTFSNKGQVYTLGFPDSLAESFWSVSAGNLPLLLRFQLLRRLFRAQNLTIVKRVPRRSFSLVDLFSLPPTAAVPRRAPTPSGAVMWQEARKHERKLRGMMVDYKRRGERRREYYEKIVRGSELLVQCL